MLWIHLMGPCCELYAGPQGCRGCSMKCVLITASTEEWRVQLAIF